MIKNLPAIQETVGSICVGKKPWKRECLSTPVFLPGESIDRHSWWATVCENEREVTQSCPTLCHPKDCSPTSSSVHGIFQAWILEWVAISSRGSSQPRDQTQVFRTVADASPSELPGKFFSLDHKIVGHNWATNTFSKAKEALSPLDENPFSCSLIIPVPPASAPSLSLGSSLMASKRAQFSTEWKIKMSHAFHPLHSPFWRVGAIPRMGSHDCQGHSELNWALLVLQETTCGSLSADAQVGTQWVKFQMLENCDQ